MINRPIYIDRLRKWFNKPVIKIISGVRRSGKSTLMKLFIQQLIKENIGKESILYINKESLEFEHIKNYTDLYQYVRSHHKKCKQKCYVFVDEVQQIEEWEKAVISLFSEDVADIYLAGSNSNLLSPELATLLGGRYIELKIFPLTYAEFLIFRGKNTDTEAEFSNFLEYGGMPGIHHLHWERDIIYEYLNAVYNTIVLKDIVQRHNIRNVAFLEKIIQYIFSNISNIFSAKRVVDFLKKERRKTNIETVYNYIHFLEEALIIYRVPRYDIKGKRLLEVREKYFVCDIGLRHAILGYRKQDINQLLENILFIELKKRNYKIFVGQLGNQEIDFMVEKEDRRAYVQVTYLMASESTVEREVSSLAQIPDNYPKYVFSLDRHFTGDMQGIRHVNLVEFLLSENMEL